MVCLFSMGFLHFSRRSKLLFSKLLNGCSSFYSSITFPFNAAFPFTHSFYSFFSPQLNCSIHLTLKAPSYSPLYLNADKITFMILVVYDIVSFSFHYFIWTVSRTSKKKMKWEVLIEQDETEANYEPFPKWCV